MSNSAAGGYRDIIVASFPRLPLANEVIFQASVLSACSCANNWQPQNTHPSGIHLPFKPCITPLTSNPPFVYWQYVRYYCYIYMCRLVRAKTGFDSPTESVIFSPLPLFSLLVADSLANEVTLCACVQYILGLVERVNMSCKNTDIPPQLVTYKCTQAHIQPPPHPTLCSYTGSMCAHSDK